jgi:TRAP-type C4-dicarboxylate transport system substrate-binding protein
MKIRTFALIGAILFGAMVEAGAQDKTFELRLSHWVPTSHPLQKALADWGASVERASKGTLKYNIYPAQQLGKAFDHYDMARDGIADLTFVNPGYQPGRFPIIAAGDLPFMISTGSDGSRALDAWYRNYAVREMSDVKFCLAFVHDPGAFHANKKILVPGDIKGMKIRPSQATIAALVAQLGGTNVQASAPEVRDMLEKGVAEAVTFPAGTVVLFGIDKILKYHMDAALTVTTFVLVFNKAKYGQMSDTQKKVIDDHCTNEWAGKIADPWADFERAGVAKLKAEAGHEVYQLTPEQLAQWKKAAEPLEQSWSDNVRKVGVDSVAAMRGFKDQLTKWNAGY